MYVSRPKLFSFTLDFSHPSVLLLLNSKEGAEGRL